MNKIIWIFGLPGSGRKRFVEAIKDNKDNLADKLELNNSNIYVINKVPALNAMTSSWQEKNNRIDVLIDSIKQEDSNERIVIIYGSLADLDMNNKEIIPRVAEHHPNYQTELIVLSPSDNDILYDRLTKTEWFKSEKEFKYRYPRTWLDVATQHITKSAKRVAEEEGFKYTEIDSTQGFIIKNNERKITK